MRVHSKREKDPRSHKGFSKGKNFDMKRLGPIMIEEILAETTVFHKHDTTIREMMMHTDPTNDASPVIKRRFKPMDNPKHILEVLQGILVIKEGVIGNNVTTGPLQYQFWRGCLEGTALSKFNEYGLAVGTETAAHLLVVEQRLVTFFSPQKVLTNQTRYIRYQMQKPKGVNTRQYVGAVHTLNQTLEKLPPNFNQAQKVPDTDIMDILTSKAPKAHKELMTDHGFDPQTATIEEFVEISERAETKEALGIHKNRNFESDDDDSSGDERHTRKQTKKHKSKPANPYNQKFKYYCKEHGPNNTHEGKACKVLNARKEKPEYRKRDSPEGKYKDYHSKYKKKNQELNVLQRETKREKAKWTKAYNKLKSEAASRTSDDVSEGEVSKSKETQRRTFTPKEHQHDDYSNSSSDSSSSSSSSSDSNSE